MSSDQSQVAVWCHVCSTSTQASLNLSTNELECIVCQSDCVERPNQGIEEFQGQSSVVDEETENSVGPENALNDLVQQVMDRILGIDSHAGGYQIGGELQQRMVNGRPVGVMIQPLQNSAGVVRVGDASILELAAGAQSHQSVFGLLSSLSSMRGRSNMFTSGTRLGASDFVSDEMTGSQWEDFLHHLLMNESSRAGAPPAPKQLLEGLPRQTVSCDADVAALGECCITQETFEVGEVMIPLICGHNYKQEPILHWLAMHNTCPVCRVEVKIES